MAETNKKTLKIASSSLLAVTMLGTTVGTNFANAEDTQPKDDDNKKTEEGTKASMPVNVDNSKINKAVKEAKDAGVEVKKDKPENHTVKSSDVDKTKEDIQKDYDKQIKALQDATKKAKDGDNSDEVKKYNEAVKKEKDAVNKAKSNPKQPKYGANEDGQAGSEYTKTGTWTNLKSKTLDGDIHVSASGKVNSAKDLNNGNFRINAYSDKKGKLSNDNIIQKIEWGNVKPKGKVTKGDMIKKQVGDGYDTQSGNPSQTWSVKQGQWVTIPKAIKLANGKTKDLQVKFDKSGDKLAGGGDWVTFWNTNGSINYYDGYGQAGSQPKDKIKASYRVADDKKGKYLWTGAAFDIDGGQKMDMNGKDYAILAVGGGLKANGDQVSSIKSSDRLGYTWGKNMSPINALDGTKSAPDGTMIYARYGNQISHTLGNTGVPGATLVANADFGISVKTSVAKAPPKPKKVNANYHLHNLNVTPENHKDVEKGVQKEDTDASIDKEEVEMGDTITYPLTNSDLPADRKDDMKSYVIQDEVPEGVEPDKENIEKNTDKDKWDVKVDGQKVTYTATKGLLEDMNKDKSKAFKVPTVGLVAKVVKGEGANFDNTFDTIINDDTVKSNQVSNTPPKLVKSSLEKFIVEDGKLVKENKAKKGDDVNYRINYNIGTDKETNKVVFSDDLEDVLDINKDSVKVYALDEKTTEDDAKATEDAKSDEKSEDAKDEAKSDDAKSDEKSEDAKSDEKSEDAKDEKTLKTGKYTVASDKDISAGQYTVTNNDGSDALVITKDKDGKTVTNETIKKDGKKDIELKDGESLSVTAGAKDVTFTPRDAEGGKGGDAKSDEQSDDSKNKAQSDDAKTDEKSKDAQSDEGQEAKKGKEITDQGELKVDEDKESFEWVAKDPQSMKGKKFYVEVTGKAKTDADYSKYEKDDVATVPNVAKLTVDDEDMDSNEVKTLIPKEEKPKPEPKKEEPQKPEPQKPEPKPEAPQAQGGGEKPIPNTGGDGNFIDKVAQTFYNIFK